MSARLLRQVASGRLSPEDARRQLERLEAEKRERRARARIFAKRGRAPGLSREARRADADALEAAGKSAAMLRADGRCEVYEKGARCGAAATDAHHAIGGRWKSDVEALPDGEGFVATCRPHHDLLFHGQLRLPALAAALEHAIRIHSRGLRRLVEGALARYRAKHPEAP